VSLCANTDPQRDSIFTKGPSDVLDHATSEIASGSKLGIGRRAAFEGIVNLRPRPRATPKESGCHLSFVLANPVPKLYNLRVVA
jgi:3-polyprenyl-4-hydroxybenzoate decarboxylase